MLILLIILKYLKSNKFILLLNQTTDLKNDTLNRY